MPNAPKMIKPGAVYFVTSRTEEGLPFLDTEKYRPICESIMARGQALYPVKIGAFHLGTNQYHAILGAIIPEDFTLFIGYVKQELAHVVNKENARQKKTVWCEGYDSPVLLGVKEVLYYTEYVYSQPVNDGLTSTVKAYKGANGYKNFVAGIQQTKHKRILRTVLEGSDERKQLAQEHTLTVDPLFWLESFSSTHTRHSARSLIIKHIKQIELDKAKERRQKKLPLKTSNPEIAKNYVPRKFGPRMSCICWDIPSRIRFLSWLKEQVAECKDVYKRWKSGDYSVEWPAWFFPPSQPRRYCPWPALSVLDLAAP